MARNRVPRNAPCPCGSGKKYKQCCWKKGFEYLADEEGNVSKSVPMSDELAQIVETQRQRFVEQFGREPDPDDHVFFDASHLEHIEHETVQAMKRAGIDPAKIYAFEKTGRLVTEDNQHLLSDADLAEWQAAIEEYRAGHGRGDTKEDDEDEWF
jgi:predicted glycoside hydrolase/deacetylase ChbG (UPF0249 family)